MALADNRVVAFARVCLRCGAFLSDRDPAMTCSGCIA